MGSWSSGRRLWIVAVIKKKKGGEIQWTVFKGQCFYPWIHTIDFMLACPSGSRDIQAIIQVFYTAVPSLLEYTEQHDYSIYEHVALAHSLSSPLSYLDNDFACLSQNLGQVFTNVLSSNIATRPRSNGGFVTPQQRSEVGSFSEEKHLWFIGEAQAMPPSSSKSCKCQYINRCPFGGKVTASHVPRRIVALATWPWKCLWTMLVTLVKQRRWALPPIIGHD